MVENAFMVLPSIGRFEEIGQLLEGTTFKGIGHDTASGK